MPKKVEYKCCICHNQLKNKDTIRLAKQLYGVSYRGGHETVLKYDFCKQCYGKFVAWIKKHKEEQ